MKLLTKEIERKLPKLYANDGMKDPEAIVKFFTPDGNWTWYATEFDGKDEFFGLVEGHEQELGYFSLADLKKVRGLMGLPVERDTCFQPTPLSKIRR